MSGTFVSPRLRASLAAGLAVGVAMSVQPEVRNAELLPKVRRARMVEIARQMAEHKWVCKPENRKAACSTRYRSRFKDNQTVSGVAYDWGGMDDETAFAKKLGASQAAGSHKEEGVTSCTTGVDCSGLVSRSWGQSKKFGTSNLASLADGQSLDRLKDLKAGDILNKPGSHVLLFVRYNPDGTIDVYEASGSKSRVVLDTKDWLQLDGYIPLRYKGAVDN